jgi:hypothetical protein
MRSVITVSFVLIWAAMPPALMAAGRKLRDLQIRTVYVYSSLRDRRHFYVWLLGQSQNILTPL